MSWRMAYSLDTLLAHVNAAAPHRRKDSDGGIGDAEHASRSSDHNPYIKVGKYGVVRARDFTHAPETGFDAHAFAETLRLSKDPRIRYLISKSRICSGTGGPSPWKWRKYSGSNPHAHHSHVSVTENQKQFDDKAQWNLSGLPKQVEKLAPAANEYKTPPATLRVGSRGELVKRMQLAVGLKGKDVDGFFGAKITLPALKKFQELRGLKPVDGICGPATWEAIGF